VRLVRVLVLGQALELELVLAQALELERVQAPGRELEREPGLGPHKQLGSQLVTVPAG